MRRLLKPLFWSLVFIVLLIAVDQMLVQVPPVHPTHASAANFYKDFRARLLDLPFKPAPAKPTTPSKPTAPQSIEAVIGKQQNKSTAPAPTAAPAAQRYVYADQQGELQFADSLEEIPLQYRGTAEPLGE